MSAAKNPGTGRPGYVGVNLLPDEIKKAEAASGQRRMIVLLTALVVVAVVGGFLGASYYASTSRDALAAAQARADAIVLEQAKYGGGQQVASQILTSQDAQKTATVAEIDWSKLITDILLATPASISITSFEIQGASPISDLTEPASPLDAPRIGSVRLSGVTGTPADIQAWVQGLQKIKGFAGSSVIQLQGGVQYTIMVYVSDARLTERYATPAPVGSDSPTDSPTASPAGPSGAPTPSPTSTEGQG